LESFIPIIISVLALLATLYQLYLQRVHDEKSLKPLPQIDFMDRGNLLYVHVQNNGVGPLIIEKLIFTKDKKTFTRIDECLDIDTKAYDHVEITSLNKKVVMPGSFLEVFSREFDENMENEMAYYRSQLSNLELKVEGVDIYDNKIIVAKSFKWFARHIGKPEPLIAG